MCRKNSVYWYFAWVSFLNVLLKSNLKFTYYIVVRRKRESLVVGINEVKRGKTISRVFRPSPTNTDPCTHRRLEP